MGIKFILISIILIIATYQDITKREVSNLASLFIIIIAMYQIEIINIIGLIINPLPMIIANIKKENSFGGADIKIMGALGLYLGAIRGLNVLLIALIIECIVKIIKKTKSEPLVPYILIGYVVVSIM